MKKLFVPMLLLVFLAACSAKSDNAKTSANTNETTEMATQLIDTATAKVLVETNLGSFTVLLYGDTPKHRDNFLRLASEHYYDGTLFHRVIKDFMVQAGDPDSRTAAPGAMLGSGGPNYKIDAEIVFPKYFHKRYALAAARQGDQVNPMKQSSGSQFYVVTGIVLNEQEIAQLEVNRKNSLIHSEFNRMAMLQRDNIIAMQQAGDRAGLQALQESLIAQAEAFANAQPTVISDEMRQVYATIGGTPHLDGEYTVFGEVIDGKETIDAIEAVQTGAADRPREDVRIISMQVISE